MKPFYIKDHKTKQAFQDAVTSNQYWKASWFITKTFKFGTTEGKAIKEFILWCKGVVHATGCHMYPIASIDIDDNGRTHIHAVILLDRYIKYRAVQPTWRCGFAWAKRFDPKRGGIIYLLTGHKYIQFQKPFCKRTSKCRPECSVLNNKSDWEWRQFTNGKLVSASGPSVAAYSLNCLQTQPTGRHYI
jgi:hypothetical protein